MTAAFLRFRIYQRQSRNGSKPFDICLKIRLLKMRTNKKTARISPTIPFMYGLISLLFTFLCCNSQMSNGSHYKE